MTKLTNIKDNVPIYVEQKFIQTDLQAKDILKTKIAIPSNFIRLEKGGKNNWGSTENLPKVLCERYGFTYEGEWIYLDIPHTLMEKLDLVKGKDISCPVYILPNVLSRKVTCGGITIEKEGEIFIQKPLQKNQSTQTESNTNEINKLKLLLNKTQSLRTEKKNLLAKISELEKGDNLNQQTVLNLQNEVAELEKNLNGLETELEKESQNRTQLQKDSEKSVNNYQTQINQLQTEITRLNNSLQVTQQEKNQLQQSLKKSLLSSLFRDKHKKQRIKELNESLSFLRGLLSDKNQQVSNLVIERNNLQNQINELNRQVTNANNLITNKDNEIIRLRNEIVRVGREKDNRPNITLDQWNNDYSRRPTRQELNDLQTQLDNAKRERDEHKRELDNHVCYCDCFCCI